MSPAASESSPLGWISWRTLCFWFEIHFRSSSCAASFLYLLPVFLRPQRWHNKGRLYFCRPQARKFLYHFLHAFSWFFRPWCSGARVVPTMKHLYVSFAVLYIARCSTRYKLTRISTYWTGLVVVRPIFKLSRVCHTELERKGHCVLMYRKEPLQCEYTASLLFFYCVTLLFFHFRPSPSSAELISIEVLALTMLYFTKPSMPSGSFSTSATRMLSHISGSYLLCLLVWERCLVFPRHQLSPIP